MRKNPVSVLTMVAKLYSKFFPRSLFDSALRIFARIFNEVSITVASCIECFHDDVIA